MKRSTKILLAILATVATSTFASISVITLADLQSTDEIPQNAAQKRCVYVDVSLQNYWQDYANQKIAAYVWKNGDGSVVPGFINGAFMERLGSTSFYRTTLPAGYDRIIFVRCDGTANSPSFAAKWDQTDDLTIPSDKDCFQISTSSPEGRFKWPGNWNVYSSYTYTITVSSP